MTRDYTRPRGVHAIVLLAGSPYYELVTFTTMHTFELQLVEGATFSYLGT